jgi:hypothetical protein
MSPLFLSLSLSRERQINGHIDRKTHRENDNVDIVESDKNEVCLVLFFLVSM